MTQSHRPAQVFLEQDESMGDSLVLWRYMDVAKFVSLLETQSIWLARADTFRDRHEGRFPDGMSEWIRKAYDEFPDDDPSPVKDAEDFQDFLVKNTFISCWHKNPAENLVMWEIYGRDGNAVAIQTSAGRIVENSDTSKLCGHSLIFRPVQYRDPREIQGVLPYEECFFYKRPHFAFEEEVRISFDTYSPFRPTKDTPFGHKLPVFLNGLIESILVHPDSSGWFVDVVEGIAKRYEVHAPVVRGSFGNS